MSFWTSLQSFLTTTETDVLNVITKIKADEVVVAADINAALHWVAANTPAIAADIQTAATIAETVGVAANPEVAAAITAANIAVQGLNAFAAASNSGQTNTQAVLSGYVAVKQAQAAVASAKAATVASPVPAT